MRLLHKVSRRGYVGSAHPVEIWGMEPSASLPSQQA